MDPASGGAEAVWRRTWGDNGLLETLVAPSVPGQTSREYEHSYRRELLHSIREAVDDVDFFDPSSPEPFSYDSADMPIEIRFANGTHQTTVRDIMHRPLSITSVGPEPGTSGMHDMWDSGTYRYDGTGNITAIGDQRYHYDALGRLTEAHVLPQASDPDETVADVITYAYDAFGNMTRRTMTVGTPPDGFELDGDCGPGQDELCVDTRNHIYESSTSTRFTYDLNGNTSRFSGKLDHQVGALWDDRDRMRVFFDGDPRNGDPEQGPPAEQYLYDAAGYRLVRTSTSGQPLISIRDEAGRTLAEFTQLPNQTELMHQQDFVYGAGQLLVEREPAGATPHAQSRSPLVDGSGDYGITVTEETGYDTYDVDIRADGGFANQLTGVSLDANDSFVIPEADLSPNETNYIRVQGLGDEDSVYSAPLTTAFDPSVTSSTPNQVRAVSASRSGTDVVIRWDFHEDNGAMNYVYFKRLDTGTEVLLTPGGLAPGETDYVVDSQAVAAPCVEFYLRQLVAATLTDPSVPTKLGGGSGECGGGDPGDPPPAPRFVDEPHHRDHLGSIRLTSDSEGWSSSTSDYSPFGTALTSSASTRRQYTGHERDTGPGLDYMFARYHGPRLGRFLSVDPLAESARSSAPQTWSRYAYVLNSPTNLVDPDGKEPNRAQAGTAGQIVDVVRRIEASNPGMTPRQALSATARHFETQRDAPGNVRYFHSEEGNWTDSKHFFTAADWAVETGELVTNVLGLGNEVAQIGGESFFSYEDLGSNALGADFGDDHFDPNGSSLSDQVSAYFDGLSPTAPAQAPNYSELPADPRTPVGSSGTVDQNSNSRATSTTTSSLVDNP